MSDITIRHAKPWDAPDMTRICHETASVAVTDDDAHAFALRWALAYLELCGDYCFVAQQHERLLGYIVGTADTPVFLQQFATHVLPQLKRLIGPEHPMAEMYLSGAQLAPEFATVVADYPAHLHINLTADSRGLGVGKQLMQAFERQLIGDQVAGVHLGVAGKNLAAVRFYQRQGYEVSNQKTDKTWVLVKSLQA